MLRTRSLFRHSPRDLLPALGGIGSLLFLLTTFLSYGALSRGAALLAFVLMSLLQCWTIHGPAHAFVHNPFFRKAWLDRVYGCMATLAIGLPHLLWRHYHLGQHRDESSGAGASIYRHGKDGAPEALWRYSLLSFFRIDHRALFRTCLRYGPEQAGQVIAESIVLGLFWLVLLAADWRFFLGFYLPSYFLGWTLAFTQDYLEHYGARPGNPFASVVNSRSRLYNRLTFNRGHVQEHHWRPETHWTSLPELHVRLAPHRRVNDAPTLRGPHLTALLEYYLRKQVRLWRQRIAARSAA